ncbi:hypothetical protein Tco_0242750, partial [Tanacetum coccineum]
KTAFRMRYGRYEFTAMPFWVDQCTSDFQGCNESGARVAFEDEFGAAEEREVSCEAQQGQSRVKRKLFRICRNNIGRDDGWSYLGVVIARPSTMWERADVVVDAWSRKGGVKPIRILMVGDVRTLIMEEAHVTKYSIRPRTNGLSERTFRTLENMYRACVRNLVVVGILTFCETEIGESKMIRLELEQETTKVDVIKERPKEAKDLSPWKGVVRFDKKGELAPRYIGPFEILERIGPVAYRLRLPDELSIGSYLSGVKITSKPEIAMNFFRTLSLYQLIS